MEVTQAFITLTVNLGKKFKNQMIVNIQEVKEAGISQRAIDYIYNTIDPEPKQAILEDEAFKDTIKAIRATDSIPQNAIEITTADQNAIAEIENGQGKTFVLRGNLNFGKTLNIPSNVTIYVDGTITKNGSHVAKFYDDENKGNSVDAVFRVDGWAGFVEEGAQNSYFAKNLAIMAEFEYKHPDPNNVPDTTYTIGWADNGTTANIPRLTQNNYFIGNTLFRPSSHNRQKSGGGYFARRNQQGKGQTYFWGNKGNVGFATDSRSNSPDSQENPQDICTKRALSLPLLLDKVPSINLKPYFPLILLTST